MKVVYYLQPSSFCFGVEKAILQLRDITKKHAGEKIYCIHALVHNPKVTKSFEEKGVHFIESIDEIKDTNAIIVFSAHGTDRNILNKAKIKYKEIYNLECPFVSKIYAEAEGYIRQGIKTFLYIGKEHHQEGKNILSYIRSYGVSTHIITTEQDIPKLTKDTELAILSQTTLNFDHVQKIIHTIQKEYPNAKAPPSSDVCKATFERQSVILENIDKFKSFIVIGGKESNNTRELYDIGSKNNKQTFYGESIEDIIKYPEEDLIKHETIAVTGGASTPQEDIEKVIDFFVGKGYEKKVITLKTC